MEFGDTQVEVTSRHYLEGHGGTPGPPPAALLTPSLSTEVGALCSALAVLGLGWGVPPSPASPSTLARSSPLCSGEAHGGGHLGWEGAVGVASPRPDIPALNLSFMWSQGCPGASQPSLTHCASLG